MEDHDAVTGREMRDALARGDNAPSGFVTENPRGGVRSGGDFLEVGTAYSAGMDLDEDFAAPNLGDRNGLKANIFLAAVDGGSHRCGNFPLDLLRGQLLCNRH